MLIDGLNYSAVSEVGVTVSSHFFPNCHSRSSLFEDLAILACYLNVDQPFQTFGERGVVTWFLRCVAV
jgi:hypothetical protein